MKRECESHAPNIKHSAPKRLIRWMSGLCIVIMFIGTCGCGKRVGVSMISPEHPHVQMLLDNAFKYVNPAHGLIDASSGYLPEGWNHDPEKGLYLRGFTQLTAIGEWVELLADIAAGQADNPYISGNRALADLSKVVESLLKDQSDPGVSVKGLLVNFLGFENDRRVGPLTSRVQRESFSEAFGEERGLAIWKVLEEKGWIAYEKGGTEARVLRSAEYGSEYFDGVLEPYADMSTKSEIMDLLDERVLTIIFGDNVNLTASVAKGIGALLNPAIKDNPKAVRLRQDMELFIENQAVGYRHLYDEDEGSFVFGWNASDDSYTGWELEDGSWCVGRMTYLINEFRGGLVFAVLRYGLPQEAIKDTGFQIKPYIMQDGRVLNVAASWDGSAFQMLGLSLFMQEPDMPGWNRILKNAVAVELDYSGRNNLPGFLSESYSGNGTEYSGAVAIPQIAVAQEPRITDAPSLYTLGVAYQIEPQLIEEFLADNIPVIETLFTEHGPWEGYKTGSREPIKFQTTAHVLSLILGLVGGGQENMKRYLTEHDMLEDLFALKYSGLEFK